MYHRHHQGMESVLRHLLALQMVEKDYLEVLQKLGALLHHRLVWEQVL